MASVAIWTAVLKPKVTSVADKSLSMVFGTPTTSIPDSACSRLATPSVSSPPMATASSACARGCRAPSRDHRRSCRGWSGTSRGPCRPGAGAPEGRPRRGNGLVLHHPPPPVAEAEESVAVVALTLAHDRPEDGVQAGAVTAAGEHSDRQFGHGCRLRARRGLRGRARGTSTFRAMGVVVAIDAGTTGVRSFAMDEAGATRGIAYREFTQHFPRPGWVDRRRGDLGRGGRDARRAGRHHRRAHRRHRHHRPARDDRGVDRKSGAPRHRAIVWQDRRTADRCGELERPGTWTSSAVPPGWCSTRTSRPPSWSGCSRKVGSSPTPTWRSGPSTAGSCGS